MLESFCFLNFLVGIRFEDLLILFSVFGNLFSLSALEERGFEVSNYYFFILWAKVFMVCMFGVDLVTKSRFLIL